MSPLNLKCTDEGRSLGAPALYSCASMHQLPEGVLVSLSQATSCISFTNPLGGSVSTIGFSCLISLVLRPQSDGPCSPNGSLLERFPLTYTVYLVREINSRVACGTVPLLVSSFGLHPKQKLDRGFFRRERRTPLALLYRFASL